MELTCQVEDARLQESVAELYLAKLVAEIERGVLLILVFQIKEHHFFKIIIIDNFNHIE